MGSIRSLLVGRRVTRLLLALVALDLELPGVVLNELLDVVRHREQPEPLLLIERHGVAPQSINGDATTLRDLEKGALAGPCAELLVLPLKSFQLRTHIICHGASSSGERSIVCAPLLRQPERAAYGVNWHC